MAEQDDWPQRLKRAVRVLEATPAAPGWLVAAVRDSVSVAAALAPRAAKPTVPIEFFYPH